MPSKYRSGNSVVYHFGRNFKSKLEVGKKFETLVTQAITLFQGE